MNKYKIDTSLINDNLQDVKNNLHSGSVITCPAIKGLLYLDKYRKDICVKLRIKPSERDVFEYYVNNLFEVGFDVSAKEALNILIENDDCYTEEDIIWEYLQYPNSSPEDVEIVKKAKAYVKVFAVLCEITKCQF